MASSQILCKKSQSFEFHQEYLTIRGPFEMLPEGTEFGDAKGHVVQYLEESEGRTVVEDFEDAGPLCHHEDHVEYAM